MFEVEKERIKNIIMPVSKYKWYPVGVYDSKKNIIILNNLVLVMHGYLLSQPSTYHHLLLKHKVQLYLKQSTVPINAICQCVTLIALRLLWSALWVSSIIYDPILHYIGCSYQRHTHLSLKWLSSSAKKNESSFRHKCYKAHSALMGMGVAVTSNWIYSL
jgi:hypothetical protein